MLCFGLYLDESYIKAQTAFWAGLSYSFVKCVTQLATVHFMLSDGAKYSGIHFWKAWYMPNKHSFSVNSKSACKGLIKAIICLIFEKKFQKHDFWISGKILSEILVQHFIGCLAKHTLPLNRCYIKLPQTTNLWSKNQSWFLN